jgi:hypothetical protein
MTENPEINESESLDELKDKFTGWIEHNREDWEDKNLTFQSDETKLRFSIKETNESEIESYIMEVQLLD